MNSLIELIELIEGTHSDGYHFCNEEAIWIKEIYNLLKTKPIGVVFRINDLLDFIFTFLWETDCMQKMLIMYNIIDNRIKINDAIVVKSNKYYLFHSKSIFVELYYVGFKLPKGVPLNVDGYTIDNIDYSNPRLINLEEVLIYKYMTYNIYKKYTIYELIN